VRPVNLLPARYRPRTGGAGSKTSYVALGALALLVLAVFGYVMTANKVSSANSEMAETRQQIAAAEAQAVTLKGFGDFAGVKEARLSAVKSLATARLDWERLFRELAHVLPNGVWLTGFDGNAASAGENDGGGETDVSSTLLLKGCADDHRQIADVIVRLRELHVADDVELARTDAAEEATGPATAPVAGVATAAEGGCGRYYAFEIRVTLDLPTPDPAAGEAVPARLGGGR
jgi:Tfp pilus assembly protein PilN